MTVVVGLSMMVGKHRGSLSRGLQDSKRTSRDETGFIQAELVWMTWTGADWTRLNLESTSFIHTSVSVASCSLLLCFSFPLDLLSDEPLFLLKLPGSLLSQTGDLVEQTHAIQ